MTENKCDTSSERIPLFNGEAESYPIWKKRFVAYLRLKSKDGKLANLVKDGNENGGEIADRVKIYDYLLLALRDEEAAIIIGENDENGISAWNHLKERFESKVTGRANTLYRQLTTARLENGESAQDFLTRVQNLAISLRAICGNVDEALVVSAALKGLEEQQKYKTFVEVYNQKKDSEQNIQDLRAALMKKDAVSPGMAESTFRVGGSRGKKQSKDDGQTTKDIQCFKCDKFGHKGSECGVLKLTCNFCNKKGHLERKCWKKNGGGPEKSKSAAEKSDDGFNFTAVEQDGADMACLTKATYEKAYVDSGCTSWMLNDRSLFVDITPVEREVMLANGESCAEIRGIGKATFGWRTESGKVAKITVDAARYVPDYPHSLIPVSKLEDKGAEVHFGKKAYISLTPRTKVQLKKEGGLYSLEMLKADMDSAMVSLDVWHQRLGHCNLNDVRKMVDGMKVGEDAVTCSVCAKSKITRKGVGKNEGRKFKKPLECIYSDVAGPIRPTGPNGEQYIVNFVDAATNYTWVEFVSAKSDVLKAIKKFELNVMDLGKVQRLHTDRGGEYCSKACEDCLIEKGIKHEYTAPHTPEQNGKAERNWRVLKEMTSCLLEESGLSKTMWPYAMETSTYIRNRCPTAALEGKKTPYEAIKGGSPILVI